MRFFMAQLATGQQPEEPAHWWCSFHLSLNVSRCRLPALCWKVGHEGPAGVSHTPIRHQGFEPSEQTAAHESFMEERIVSAPCSILQLTQPSSLKSSLCSASGASNQSLWQTVAKSNQPRVRELCNDFVYLATFLAIESCHSLHARKWKQRKTFDILRRFLQNMKT